MHTETLDPWTHSHDFEHRRQHEARTWAVVAITGTVMVVELIAGYLSGSMALVADGWHMGSHFGALALAGFAYGYARRQLGNPRYTFGAGKVYALAGYTNAILLAVVALAMVGQSVERMIHPVHIDFLTALPVAVFGLVVNLASALILQHGSGDHAHGELHGHEHGHEHDHDHGHADGHGHLHNLGRLPGLGNGDGKGQAEPGAVDHNLRAAYLHVLADAVTSVAAIVALLGGYLMGWNALDPIMGVVGAALIIRWSWGLSRSASRQLLDVVPSEQVVARIRQRLEAIDDTRVADLHLWEMAPGRRGCIVSLVAAEPHALADYREAVAEAAEVHHLTVEVFRCEAPAVSAH